MKTKTRQGSVKVVNALATIHKILNEIAPSGTLECTMQSKKSETVFAFVANGVCATFHLQEYKPMKKGGKR